MEIFGVFADFAGTCVGAIAALWVLLRFVVGPFLEYLDSDEDPRGS